METTDQRPELVTIVGPTASGKSELAMKLAHQFNGEIIAADSRTIYIGMDVGTAKPSKEDQKMVPHWGLDLVEPGQNFNAFQFKKYAQSKIKEIQERGKLPILVGGTGLYIDSVLFDFEFIAGYDPAKREGLEKLSIERLQKIIQNKDYPMPQNFRNRRHLVRTIERSGQTGSKSSIKDNALLIGIMPEVEVLRKRINQRSTQYFRSGLLEETQNLLKKYGKQRLQKTHGIAYIAAARILAGELDQPQAIQQIQKQEWQYARRQRTWFRRNKFIQWFGSVEEAYIFCSKKLV